MISSLKLMLTVLAVAAVGSLAPSRGEAQQVCGFCSDHFDDLAFDWYHQFEDSGAMTGCGTNTCHYTYGAGGFCSQGHPVCDPPTAMEIQKVRLAVQDGQLEVLRNLMNDSSGKIVVNRAAGSVDILSCEGTLTERIPAQKTLILAIAD
jgi:hypothetical protein